VLPAEPTRCCLIMRTLCEEFERRYSELFRDMSTTLQVSPGTVRATFLGVCDELFRGSEDQLEVKWGRIVAMFTMAGALAVQCVEKGIQIGLSQAENARQVSDIVDCVTLYTQTHLSNWFDSHNGWNGFVQYYEKMDNEERWSQLKKVMTGVGVAGGIVGGLALAAILAGRS